MLNGSHPTTLPPTSTMGFWSAIKRGLGLGPPRAGESRRLQKRQRTPSIIESSAGSGTIASSRTSVTASRAAPLTESAVVVNTPSFYPSVPTVPEEIEIIEDDIVGELPERPKKTGFWRRFSRRKRRVQTMQSPPRTTYTIPSTSDLMHGVAPIAPSATDSGLREQVREAMGLPPRTPISDALSARSEASRVPSLVRSPVPMRMSPVPSPPIRRGTLSDIALSSPKPPSPPLARQTPRLATIDVPATSARAAGSRSVSGGSGARKISVREISRDGSDVDAQSIAAMSYVSRKPKSARIFEVAEVINGDAGASPVAEPPGAKGTGSLVAIEQWALGYSTRFDTIEEKLQVLKSEILASKQPKRRYFSA